MDKEFIRVFNMYKNDIYRLIYSYTHNVSDTDDLTQNVFIKLYKNINKFNDDIKLMVNSWHTNIEVQNFQIEVSSNNNFIEVPIDAPKEKKSMSYKELIDLLKVNILHLDNNIINYKPYLNIDNTIGRIDVWDPYLVKYSDDKYINSNITILNKYADKTYIDAIESSEGLDATGGKELVSEYTPSNINVKVFIYRNNWSNTRLSAIFVYDNIIYILTCENVSINELKETINKLQ